MSNPNNTSRIFGDPDAIKRARSARSGDKTTYVNWDAINELPDEFEVVLTEVEFDFNALDVNNKNPKAAFSNVGSKNQPSWYPKTELLYAIGEACGISGGEHPVIEPIVEEVDINPMLCKPLDAAPTMRRMTVGRRVTKQSVRLMEDGTLRRSSPCTADFNAWEYCMESWTKEEMYTEGYSKQNRYDNKYENTYKRRAHFAGTEGMKFAHRKAETKAYCKTIRELAGLPTGFSSEDLKEGKLVFAKVRRSRKILQAESAARLSAIANGATSPSAALLFGDQQQQLPAPSDVVADMPMDAEPEDSGMGEEPPEDAGPAVEFPEDEPEKTKREQLIAVFTHYFNEHQVQQGETETVQRAISWLDRTPEAEADTTFWPKAVNLLQQIESRVPENERIAHTIYA